MMENLCKAYVKTHGEIFEVLCDLAFTRKRDEGTLLNYNYGLND